MDEVFRNLLANRPDLDPGMVTRTRALMNDAIRDVEVTGFEDLIAELDLPDSDDRHVLAAAIRAEATVIVTFNLKDFPSDAVAEHEISAQHPDVFLTERFDENPAIVVEAIQRISASTRSPHLTEADVVERLFALDLPVLAGRLRLG